MNFLTYQYYNNLPDEDKILSKKVLDWIKYAENKFIVKFSFFLDEKQCNLCESVLNSVNYENYKFFGGHDNASRKVLAIYPQHYDLENNDFPFKPLLFSYRTCDVLTHRDFLGCLMSHQVSREMIGDILVSTGKCIVFLYETIYEYIFNNVEKIGSVGVSKSDDISTFDFNVSNNFQQIKCIVSSLRLDCILSAVTKLSREKTSLLIRNIGVVVNYTTINSASEKLNIGDTFSIRGHGKFIFESISGTTKKDRICIIITKYV